MAGHDFPMLAAGGQAALELSPYRSVGESGQAGETLLGDLGVMQRFESSLVVLVDHRLHCIPSSGFDDHLLQLVDSGFVEPRVTELLQQQLLSGLTAVGVRMCDQHRALAFTKIIS